VRHRRRAVDLEHGRLRPRRRDAAAGGVPSLQRHLGRRVPAANAAGCSGHWFTERDGVVAAAWYEHGTHFFDIDHTTGTIRRSGSSSRSRASPRRAYWIDDEFVYTVDGTRGFDIIRFDRDAVPPAEAELTASWLSTLGVVNPVAEQLRTWCSLAAAG
jgi:hypothetical protein